MSNGTAFIFQLRLHRNTPSEVIEILTYLTGGNLDKDDELFKKAAEAIYHNPDVSPRRLQLFHSENVPYHFDTIDGLTTQTEFEPVRTLMEPEAIVGWILRSYAGTKGHPGDGLAVLNWLSQWLVNMHGPGEIQPLGYVDFSDSPYAGVHQYQLKDGDISLVELKDEHFIESLSVYSLC